MKVQNLKGTTENTCKCVSWLDHWKKFSQQTTSQCVVIGCTNLPEVGGHVQKMGLLEGNNWYIIPICKQCNGKNGQTLNVDDRVNLVSANVSQTCG